MYDVIGVIGTMNPQIEVTPYLSIESLISGEQMDQLTEWLVPIFPEKKGEILISASYVIFHWKKF